MRLMFLKAAHLPFVGEFIDRQFEVRCRQTPDRDHRNRNRGGDFGPDQRRFDETPGRAASGACEGLGIFRKLFSGPAKGELRLGRVLGWSYKAVLQGLLLTSLSVPTAFAQSDSDTRITAAQISKSMASASGAKFESRGAALALLPGGDFLFAMAMAGFSGRWAHDSQKSRVCLKEEGAGPRLYAKMGKPPGAEPLLYVDDDAMEKSVLALSVDAAVNGPALVMQARNGKDLRASGETRFPVSPETRFVYVAGPETISGKTANYQAYSFALPADIVGRVQDYSLVYSEKVFPFPGVLHATKGICMDLTDPMLDFTAARPLEQAERVELDAQVLALKTAITQKAKGVPGPGLRNIPRTDAPVISMPAAAPRAPATGEQRP